MRRGEEYLGSVDGVLHTYAGVEALRYSGVIKVVVRGESDIKRVDACACRHQVFFFVDFRGG